jgi:hypothetical protein
VIANETCAGRALCDEIRYRARGYDADVLVIAPALSSPVRYWASDVDGARAAAQARVDASLAALAAAGERARGDVGDADPLQALDDGLRTFGGDEIIVSTHPRGRSNWLERNVVERARELYDLPITHVVVDLEHEEAFLRLAGRGSFYCAATGRRWRALLPRRGSGAGRCTRRRRRVLAGHDVRRHAEPDSGERDLLAHDLLEGALLEPLLARAAEGVVEVRADLALRAGVRERVARAATRLPVLALDEELLPVGEILALAHAGTGAAAGREHEHEGSHEHGEKAHG